MIIRQTILAGACISLTLALACSGSGNGNGSDGGGGSSSSNSSQGPAGCKAYSPCDVLTAPDVNGVLSTNFGDGGPESLTIGPLEETTCTYTNAGGRVIFSLNCGVEVPASEFPGMEADAGHTTMPVSGIGAAAFAIDGTSLQVYVGSNINFSIAIFTSGDGGALTPPANALANAETLAMKVAARLP